MLQLWPGAVHWPDYKNPAAVSWWQSEMEAFHSEVEYDGLWLDMNEVSNYCTGDVCQNPGTPSRAASTSRSDPADHPLWAGPHGSCWLSVLWPQTPLRGVQAPQLG